VSLFTPVILLKGRKMVKVIIMGPNGKMGRAMVQSASKNPNIKIIGGIGPKNREYIGMDLGPLVGLAKNIGAKVFHDIKDIIEKCDVVLDCTQPEVSIQVLEICKQYKKALVTGTTGFSKAERKQLEASGKRIPVLHASNTSTMVHLLFSLVKIAAKQIGIEADIDIIEMHGNTKADAPSGTGLEIAEIISKELGWNLNEIAEYGRKGKGLRPAHSINFSSIRSGEIPSSHQVIFGVGHERLELTHHAYNMKPFAEGMIEAALFISEKSPGCYDLNQVLKRKD
jgi:4-hydroxy-tetrahydrodipicolinate reductase